MFAGFTLPPFLLLATATATVATQASGFLYVSSYSGNTTTLDLSAACSAGGCGGAIIPGVPLLRTVSSTNGCAGSPSWLTLDRTKPVLFCVDEGLTTAKGSLSSFATSAHGDLRRLDKVSTLGGPVSGVMYGKGQKRGLAVAHYSPGALTTWDVSDPSHLSLVQTDQYKIARPGPNPDRQGASHAHEAFLDPTGSFILVPDLGADKIHVYAIRKPTDLKLTALPPIRVKPGSGPRHITFAVRHGKTFMYLVTELANTIIGYQVTYRRASVQFRELFTIGTHGAGNPVPSGAAAAEIAVSPDANFLIVSSRNENTLSIPNFDPKNSTRIISDPLINFSIDGDTGTLTKIQQVPCGGRFPRQFSINRAGTLLAVAQQSDGRVVLIDRDVETGRLGKFAAYANIPGQVTSVIFDEDS
ncbi:hypothetical protein E4U36_007015 [Claviceps purpurea]|nr:hypothetical protein E4U36_007015 [Claviceps purpurea]